MYLYMLHVTTKQTVYTQHFITVISKAAYGNLKNYLQLSDYCNKVLCIDCLFYCWVLTQQGWHSLRLYVLIYLHFKWTNKNPCCKDKSTKTWYTFLGWRIIQKSEEKKNTH